MIADIPIAHYFFVSFYPCTTIDADGHSLQSTYKSVTSPEMRTPNWCSRHPFFGNNDCGLLFAGRSHYIPALMGREQPEYLSGYCSMR